MPDRDSPAASEPLSEPGQLLVDLERRQDDVLEQLDHLDARLTEVLKGLEPARDDGERDDEPEPE